MQQYFVIFVLLQRCSKDKESGDKMAESGDVVYEVSPEINVLTDNLNINKNCNQCLHLGREI
jgi:hypothetical protein